MCFGSKKASTPAPAAAVVAPQTPDPTRVAPDANPAIAQANAAEEARRKEAALGTSERLGTAGSAPLMSG